MAHLALTGDLVIQFLPGEGLVDAVLGTGTHAQLRLQREG